VDIETTTDGGFALDVMLPLEEGVVPPQTTVRSAAGPADAQVALK
jgi:hypothetical protein